MVLVIVFQTSKRSSYRAVCSYRLLCTLRKRPFAMIRFVTSKNQSYSLRLHIRLSCGKLGMPLCLCLVSWRTEASAALVCRSAFRIGDCSKIIKKFARAIIKMRISLIHKPIFIGFRLSKKSGTWLFFAFFFWFLCRCIRGFAPIPHFLFGTQKGSEKGIGGFAAFCFFLKAVVFRQAEAYIHRLCASCCCNFKSAFRR